MRGFSKQAERTTYAGLFVPSFILRISNLASVLKQRNQFLVPDFYIALRTGW